MTLTTDASADSITFASSGGGGGTLPFTDFDGTTDNIVLSSASTGWCFTSHISWWYIRPNQYDWNYSDIDILCR